MILKLAPLFGDGMILQRGKSVSVCGEIAEAGKVSAKFNGVCASGAFEAGEFRLKLPPSPAGRGLTMSVKYEGGVTEEAEFKDVYCGEVWVAGGQSNMSMFLYDSETYKNGYRPADNAEIRLYTVGRNVLAAETEFPDGYGYAYEKDRAWQGVTAESAKIFSAAGYYFAKYLNEELGVPVGVINCNVGGSPIYAWLSEKTLLVDERLKAGYLSKRAEIESKDAEDDLADFKKALEAGKAETDENGRNGVVRDSVYVYCGANRYAFQQPRILYDAMLKRANAFTARGMIWYQGESEGFGWQAPEYELAQSALLKQIKADADDPAYSFHYVQIAPWKCPENEYWDWAGICDAQREFSLHDASCGMITTADVSGGEDIHPPKKEQIGRRLADAALTLDYGKPREYSGPVAYSARREGGAIVIKFYHNDGLTLDAHEGKFEIESGGGAYKPAREVSAKVVGGEVVIEDSPEGDFVRYGWETYYKIGLKNSAGLPASPFRIKIKNKT